MGSPADPFADAQALFQRARRHKEEFDLEAAADRWLNLSAGSKSNGSRTCALMIRRNVLLSLKPVVSDIASNLIHSLDHVVAACARMNGKGRLRDLYYPVEESDDKFKCKIRRHILPQHEEAIIGARSRNAAALHSLKLLKEIANTCKHWELAPAATEIRTIAISPPGEQQVFIYAPQGHFLGSDRFEFPWPPAVPLDVPFNIVHRLKIETSGEPSGVSPNAMFLQAIRYAQATIDAVRNAS